MAPGGGRACTSDASANVRAGIRRGRAPLPDQPLTVNVNTVSKLREAIIARETPGAVLTAERSAQQSRAQETQRSVNASRRCTRARVDTRQCVCRVHHVQSTLVGTWCTCDDAASAADVTNQSASWFAVPVLVFCTGEGGAVAPQHAAARLMDPASHRSDVGKCCGMGMGMACR